MFGIAKIKRELKWLETKVKKETDLLKAEVKLLQKENEILKRELKYPALFREGQTVGPYVIVEILKVGEYDGDRQYKVLDVSKGTITKLCQGGLFIWDVK